jgi:hypothetical protein
VAIVAIRIERSNDVSVQCPQHRYAGVHQKVAAYCGADQATGGVLPFVELLLGRRKFGHAVAGILRGDELATIGQMGSHHRTAASCPSPLCEQVPRLPACMSQSPPGAMPDQPALGDSQLDPRPILVGTAADTQERRVDQLMAIR